MIHFVTGGARSGKSNYAKGLAENFSSVTFVATAIAFDESMKQRIMRHQQDRPANWQTLEQWHSFSEPFNTDCVLVDCITLMVSNLMLKGEIDFDKLTQEEIEKLEQNVFFELDGLLKEAEGKELILVSNEVGLGLAAPTAVGNIFRDIAGRVNQYLAQQADRVVFMVSGIPLIVKDEH